MRSITALTLMVAAPFGTLGCLEGSAFDVDIPEGAEGTTQKNIKALEALKLTRPYSFVAMGDVHDAYDEIDAVVQSINARKDVKFVVLAGDFSDLGLSQEFSATYAGLNALSMPWLTVIGNHDALGNGTTVYKTLYGALDYAVTVAGTRFIFFNSNTLEFPDTVPNKEFLTAEHEGLSDGAIWVTHQRVQAPDDVEGGDAREYYESLLDQYPVDLVVHSHLSDFELYTWRKTPQLQCGTFEKVFLFTVVHVADDGISYEKCNYDQCSPVTPTPESP